MPPDLDRLADRKLAQVVANGGRLRALVLELWQRTRMDWGFVTDRLALTFRKETWVGSHERRFVGETLYGLVRHLRRVDLAIERGRKAKKPPKDLERLIALLVLEDELDPERAAAVVPDIDWHAVRGVDDAIAGERNVTKRIALGQSLPDWLAKRLVAEWGGQAEALARSLNERAPMTVRANLLVNTRDELAATLDQRTTPGRWSDTALIVQSRVNLYGLDAFKAGAMEAQDEGSQLLADIAAAGNPKLVIDLCAGAGGKTLAIAARVGNHGRIVASDVDEHKLEELRKRARRAKVTNAQPLHLGADGVWPPQLEAYLGKADMVFVDAPCTGIGALRRNPEARWRLREADLATFAKRQREILAGARALCAPGGRIMYATCTLLAVENREVVDAVVAAHPELRKVPMTEHFGERARELGDGESFTVAPHTHGTDGFWASVLTRT